MEAMDSTSDRLLSGHSPFFSAERVGGYAGAGNRPHIAVSCRHERAQQKWKPVLRPSALYFLRARFPGG
jgi:hypothetical protein